MQLMPHSVFLLVCAAVACPCFADDSVSIRYRSGYSVPGYASETSSMSFVRPDSPFPPFKEVEIDRYFSEVSQLLARYKVDQGCGFVAADGPSVKVEVQLNARRYAFEYTLGESGKASLPLQASEEQQQCAEVFDALLSTSLRHARVRFGGAGK